MLGILESTLLTINPLMIRLRVATAPAMLAVLVWL